MVLIADGEADITGALETWRQARRTPDAKSTRIAAEPRPKFDAVAVSRGKSFFGWVSAANRCKTLPKV